MQVIEAAGHDPGGGVGQVERVAQLVQRGAQARHVVGPIVLPAEREREGSRLVVTKVCTAQQYSLQREGSLSVVTKVCMVSVIREKGMYSLCQS